MKLIFVILASLSIISLSFAQPQVNGMWLYDHNNNDAYDMFYDIYAASNSDFLLCGVAQHDAWVARIDSAGQTIWNAFPGSRYLYSIIETDNGDIVSGGRLSDNFAAVRLNRNGERIWRRDFGSGGCKCVIELKQGDLILAGWLNDYGYITRLDGNGDQIWERTYEDPNDHPWINTMRETDGGVVTAGYIESGRRGWIQKIDFNGNIIWSHYYGRGIELRSMVSIPSGFAIAGNTLVARESFASCVLLKINPDGEVTSDQRYEVCVSAYESYGIEKYSDDGFIIVGRKCPSNLLYPYAMRVDNQGNLLWSTDFARIVDAQQVDVGELGYNRLHSVIVLQGDVPVACGSLWNNEGERKNDGLIVKFGPDPVSPQFIAFEPQDTVLNVLFGDSIRFWVRARNGWGDPLNYRWSRNDSLVSEDTTVSLTFDSLRFETITCSISDSLYHTSLNWHVTVTDLFIRSFLPDTTELTLRRGTTQEFSLDVAATPGDAVNYNWWLTDLTERHDSLISDQANASYLFPLSGDYRLQATAYGGESSDTTGWLIHVKSVVQAFWPRNLSLSAHPDTTINFGVLPFNQQSDSLHYLWLRNGVQIDTTSEVAVSFPDSGMQVITAIVMDGSEGDTLNWTVSVSQVTGVRWQGVRRIPSELTLYPPSPNPFNSITSIGPYAAGSIWNRRQVGEGTREWQAWGRLSLGSSVSSRSSGRVVLPAAGGRRKGAGAEGGGYQVKEFNEEVDKHLTALASPETPEVAIPAPEQTA
jgi:hypothetical protein